MGRGREETKRKGEKRRQREKTDCDRGTLEGGAEVWRGRVHGTLAQMEEEDEVHLFRWPTPWPALLAHPAPLPWVL